MQSYGHDNVFIVYTNSPKPAGITGLWSSSFFRPGSKEEVLKERNPTSRGLSKTLSSSTLDRFRNTFYQ